MPASASRKIQLGQETAWGTAVAATVVLAGVEDASITPELQNVRISDIGTLAPSMRDVQASEAASGKISAIATYEHLLYFLHGLFGPVSPTGTASPYSWAYAAPLTAAPTPQCYSLEYGAGSTAYVMAGAIMDKVKIKIEAGKLWEVSADLLGKSVRTVTLATLNNSTVEAIRAADTALTIDTWAGTVGTTTVAGTLVSADVEIDPKRHLKSYVTGQLQPYGYGDDRWDGSIKMVLEYNAVAKAYVDALLAPALVQRQIQLKATSGTKTATIQFAGTLTKGVELFKDRAGNMTVELDWTGTYNSTLANWLKVTVANASGSLT